MVIFTIRVYNIARFNFMVFPVAAVNNSSKLVNFSALAIVKVILPTAQIIRAIHKYSPSESTHLAIFEASLVNTDGEFVINEVIKYANTIWFTILKLSRIFTIFMILVVNYELLTLNCTGDILSFLQHVIKLKASQSFNCVQCITCHSFQISLLSEQHHQLPCSYIIR